MPRHSLEILDSRLARGDTGLTARDVQLELGMSPQAASNLLRRWREAGLVDQVARGHYVIRQLGLLGTRAASEDVALAVGAFFAQLPHRLAYRSALDHHGLLVHPARTIQVACSKAVAVETLSGRRLQTVREPESTVQVATEPAGYGALVSTAERALIDGATRPDLLGGIDVLAVALSLARVEPDRLLDVAAQLDATAALRRIGSLADRLAIPDLAEQLRPLRPPPGDLDLGPRAAARPLTFRDPSGRVRWSVEPSELAAVVEQ
jgi:predicted transcriptional regulator of viral defense system